MVDFLRKKTNPSAYYIGYDDDTDKWCVFSGKMCVARYDSSTKAWEDLARRVGRGKLIENYPYAANPKNHLSRESVRAMTASEINRNLDRLDEESSRIMDEFIAAGRGTERPSEWLRKDDPLSLRARSNSEQRSILRDEASRRYGPGAPSRLPGRQSKTIGRKPR